MKENKLNGIPVGKIIFYVITIVGIWFIWREWLRRKRLKTFLKSLLPSIRAALASYEQLVNFDFYFTYTDESKYLASYKLLSNEIIDDYLKVGIGTYDLETFNKFKTVISNISRHRESYNNEFVKVEAERYTELFENLDTFALSKDQIEAVLRDEDNNLIIAGAGTGKTTTVSAKIAYILNKELAKPDELLIITFTRNAANEMHARTKLFCRGLVGDDTLDVRTFNSFGYMVERVSTRDHKALAFNGDDTETKSYLQRTFNQLFVDDPIFQKKAINFIAFFSRPPRDEFAFETGDAYMKHEANFKNVTLNGIKVKSKEEMEIGNFFYLNKVNFRYEQPFPLKEEDIDFTRQAYCPDFYLPDYEIWHEHYGINRNGDVPSWFSYRPPYNSAREYYHSLINWKENIHKKYRTTLIKTHSFESNENRLIQTLKTHLQTHNVVMEKRNPDEILQVILESEHYEDFMDLVYTFLNLMKSNAKTPEDFRTVISDSRLNVFLDVFMPLYEQYQGKLLADNAIDYNDMINKATYHINNGRYTKRYKYILVDEFQDMSLGRYELVKSIKNANPGAKFYGVGDDWQSIFRFTGSDISIITEFKKYFGFTYESHVLQTYRFNEDILRVTSKFILKNPSQITKELTSGFRSEQPSFSLVGLDFQGKSFPEQAIVKLNELDVLLAKIENLKDASSVFLIGRYNHNKPSELKRLADKYSSIDVTYHTAHGVKGLTCDYSILLDVDSGKLGFPSEIADDPILNYLLHEGDSFDNAEERRVFYVALTRARHHNFIMFNHDKPSKFIDELIADGFVENPFGETVICPMCQGRMVKRNGPRNQFYGCTNYPRCNGILPVK